MTAAVESTTPSAVIDRVSLVLDAFDGPGRLTLAQIVRRTGLSIRVVRTSLEGTRAVVAGIEQRLGLRPEHHEVPGGSRVTASTELLRALVPEVDGFGFDATYLPRLLDRYATTAAPVR